MSQVSLLLLCSALSVKLHRDPCGERLRGLKTSHASKQPTDLSSVGMPCARAHVRFATHRWLRRSACMLTSVYTPSKCMCGEHAAVLFHFKDAGTLRRARLHADRLSLMSNYLQQCKTNPLIMMCCRATFQHDSRRCLLCSKLIWVTQSCLRINSNATFYPSPVGRPVAAYSPPTVRVFGLVVKASMCTCLFLV